jgi:hypothetical protein
VPGRRQRTKRIETANENPRPSPLFPNVDHPGRLAAAFWSRRRFHAPDCLLANFLIWFLSIHIENVGFHTEFLQCNRINWER